MTRLRELATSWTCTVCHVVVPNGQKHRCAGTLR